MLFSYLSCSFTLSTYLGWRLRGTFISQSLHPKEVLFVKVRVYEAIMHSFVADLFSPFPLKFFVKD